MLCNASLLLMRGEVGVKGYLFTMFCLLGYESVVSEKLERNPRVWNMSRQRDGNEHSRSLDLVSFSQTLAEDWWERGCELFPTRTETRLVALQNLK